MAEEMTQEQMMELQKKNCIFCKIVRGEMPSLKVYEDDGFLAVLDIKPASIGHILLMPKEHVLFLPLLPESLMSPMFELATKLSLAVKDAMISDRVTIFIASGTAAEQPPPPLMHLIMHIIPREKGDGLDALDVNALDKEQSDTLALTSMFAQATKQALMHKKRDDLLKENHLHKKTEQQGQNAVPKNDVASRAEEVASNAHDDAPPGTRHQSRVIRDDDSRKKPSPVPTEYEDSEPRAEVRDDGDGHKTRDISMDASVPMNAGGASDAGSPGSASNTTEFDNSQDALAAVLDMYPDLRRLIIAQPDLVAEYISKSPQLAKLFEGVNLRALGLMLSRKEQQASEQTNNGSAAANDTKPAIEMTEEELMRFIDGNQGLRQWLLEHPEELATRLGENKRLSQFFKGVDVLSLSRRYREHFSRTTGSRGTRGGD